MPRNPRTASQSSAGEAARRWSAHGAAPLEYFADISSCDMISSVQKGPCPGHYTRNLPGPQRNQHKRPHGPIARCERTYIIASVRLSGIRSGHRAQNGERGWGTRTDVDATYDADADATRNPAQETVPRAWDFANAVQVFTWRQSLLVHQCVSLRVGTVRARARIERRRTLNASRTSDQ